MKNIKSINRLHWITRIIGTMMVMFTLFFFIGYLIEGINKPSASFNVYTIILFIVWGIGLLAILLANWKPGFGGILSFISFIIFNILAAINPNPEAGYSFILLIFLLPSILFLIVWKLNQAS